MKNLRFILIVVIFSFCFAQDLPEKPSFIHPVIDSTNTLSANEYNSLYEKLKNYSDTTSTEILVLIAYTTYGNDINLYAAELGHKWQIGQADKDNGIVLLVALQDRDVAIQTGYGVEHLLTDALSKRIIENIILPNFKNGDYFSGIDRAVSAIISILNGEYEAEESEGDFPIGLIIFIIIIFIIIYSVSKRNRGGGIKSGHSNSDILQEIFRGIVLSSQGKGSFGSGGSFGGKSSGGFGGFGGGGSFGGGGASGSW